MILSLISRECLLDFLPKNGICAEIGVAEGIFSTEILNRMSPDQLHLIDPWISQVNNDYVKDVNNVSQDEQDCRFTKVVNKFKKFSQVIINRAFSIDAAKAFPDSHFDFIYIDAVHTYDAILDDLTTYSKKMKPTGVIAGHDFASHVYARQQGFGVIGAVSEFVKRSNYELFLVTYEEWSSYVLVPREMEQIKKSILNRLLIAGALMVELPSSLGAAIRHDFYQVPNGRSRLLISFSS